MTTYNRPVAAKLIVRLENGEEWEAKPEDLDQFGYTSKLDTYDEFQKALQQAVNVSREDIPERYVDLIKTSLNPIRYLAEQVIMFRNVASIHVPENTIIDVGNIYRDLEAFRGEQI